MASLSTSSGSSSFSLALRLQDGSTAAWSELVELYGPLVEKWCIKAGLGSAAREDIAQEVFLSVHRSISTFDPSRSDATFRGWLWRITRNTVLQSLRKPQPPPRGGSTALAALGAIANPWPDAQNTNPHPKRPTQPHWSAAHLLRSSRMSNHKPGKPSGTQQF